MVYLHRQRVAGVLLAAAFFAATGAAAQVASAGVAVVHDAPWAPGDSARDGAGEFAVFLRAAQLQRAHRAAGLVALSDRHGMLRSGGERALRRVVLTGVVVVKLLPVDAVAEVGDVFLSVRALTPAIVSDLLQHCLEHHGPPPSARDPENPTARELAAIRAHLEPFQAALDVTAAPRLVAR